MAERVTAKQMSEIMPFASKANINKYLNPINQTMLDFGIETTIRKCHFLAQIAHESGSLVYNEEIASGEAYEGRKDLGNTRPGDGVKYKGRGLIQLTGRYNYQAFQDWLKMNTYYEGDIMEHPEEVCKPDLSALAAGWYWSAHSINFAADRDDVVAVTKLVNGGRNGLQERIDFLNRAKVVLDYL